MKNWISLLLLVPGLMYSQQKADVKVMEDKNLVEAVYHYENGAISQKGTFNMQGELHGKWVSYAPTGEKLAMGQYVNGKKDGKWFFWDDGTLREVDYSLNVIASVHEWKEGTKVAVNR